METRRSVPSGARPYRPVEENLQDPVFPQLITVAACGAAFLRSPSFLIRNEGVTGSSPVIGTTQSRLPKRYC